MKQLFAVGFRQALALICACLSAACCWCESPRFVRAEDNAAPAHSAEPEIPRAKKGYKGREIAVTMHYLRRTLVDARGATARGRLARPYSRL